MGRVAVEILPPLARDEGGTAFRVKDDRILSQDARARIFDVKTASHRGLSELLVGKPFFRFDLQIPRLAPCVSRWNAGVPSSRGARSANGALLSGFMGRRPSPWVWPRNAGLPSSRGTRSANGALPSRFGDSDFRRARRGGAQACRSRAVRGRRMACCRPGSGIATFAVRVAAEHGLAIFTRSAIGSLSRLMRDGRFRACCRPRRAYEFLGLRGGFLQVFSHGR